MSDNHENENYWPTADEVNSYIGESSPGAGTMFGLLFDKIGLDHEIEMFIKIMIAERLRAKNEAKAKAEEPNNTKQPNGYWRLPTCGWCHNHGTVNKLLCRDVPRAGPPICRDPAMTCSRWVLDESAIERHLEDRKAEEPTCALCRGKEEQLLQLDHSWNGRWICAKCRGVVAIKVLAGSAVTPTKPDEFDQAVANQPINALKAALAELEKRLPEANEVARMLTRIETALNIAEQGIVNSLHGAKDALRGETSLRQPQTATTGIGAIIGQWPGKETEEELLEMVKQAGTNHKDIVALYEHKEDHGRQLPNLWAQTNANRVAIAVLEEKSALNAELRIHGLEDQVGGLDVAGSIREICAALEGLGCKWPPTKVAEREDEGLKAPKPQIYWVCTCGSGYGVDVATYEQWAKGGTFMLPPCGACNRSLSGVEPIFVTADEEQPPVEPTGDKCRCGNCRRDCYPSYSDTHVACEGWGWDRKTAGITEEEPKSNPSVVDVTGQMKELARIMSRKDLARCLARYAGYDIPDEPNPDILRPEIDLAGVPDLWSAKGRSLDWRCETIYSDRIGAESWSAAHIQKENMRAIFRERNTLLAVLWFSGQGGGGGLVAKVTRAGLGMETA